MRTPAYAKLLPVTEFLITTGKEKTHAQVIPKNTWAGDVSRDTRYSDRTRRSAGVAP